MKQLFKKKAVVFLSCEFALAVLFYILVLVLPASPFVGRFLKYGSFLPAICLTLIFCLLFSRKSGWFRILTLLATILLFAVPLSWLWQNDTADWGLIGGILPVSDASIYTMDAQRLVQGAFFSPVSSFRPMANGFISVLLKISSNFPVSLAALVFLAAISLYALAREVNRIRGPLVAAVTLVVLFFFYRTYIGKALTESLGITFGALAFVSILAGVRKKTRWQVLFGIAMLTLALNVRAGAFIALFTLLLWGGYFFRKRWLVSGRFIVVGTLIIFSGFGLNSILLRAIGAPGATPFSNFADSFYGVAAGYKGWRYIREIHPNATTAEKYQYILALIKDNPRSLLVGIARSYIDFFNPASYNIFSFMNFHVKEGGNLYTGSPGTENSIVYYPFFLLGGLGLVNCIRRRAGWSLLVLSGWAGMLASIPFVPPIDAGIRPYAVTIPLVAFLLGEGINWLAQLPGWKMVLEVDREESIPWTVPFSIVLAVLVIAGPILVKITARETAAPAPDQCPQGEDYLLVQPVNGARIDLMPDSQETPYRRPAMRLADFRDNVHRLLISPQLAQSLSELPAGQSIQYSIDLGNIGQDFRPIIFAAASQSLPTGPSPLQICSRLIGDEFMGRFFIADQTMVVATQNPDLRIK